jgi:TetR/AcrR family transcriptional repressor of mexJK operon
MTMEGVAEAARVSKMTVYSYFRDRDTLFQSLVHERAATLNAALASPESAELVQDFERTMVEFGIRFVSLVLDPKVLRVVHELCVAAPRNPAVALAFYEAGPGQTLSFLSSVVAAAAQRGTLRVEDPNQAADDLVSLWLGDQPHRVALGVQPPLEPAEIEARVRHGWRLFLKAYAP